jgi:hypothetical protein
MRQAQLTEAWPSRYNVRAGIEGTLSQGIRVFGMRRTRLHWLGQDPLAASVDSRRDEHCAVGELVERGASC